jgi:transcriptional regulator with XRE-family HTH domain
VNPRERVDDALVGVGEHLVTDAEDGEPFGAQTMAMATLLGSRLKAVRERIGLSRSEAARRAGIDPAMLHRIENADNSAPTFETIVRLAQVLDIDLEWLARRADADVEDDAATSRSDPKRLRARLMRAMQSLQLVLDNEERGDNDA